MIVEWLWDASFTYQLVRTHFVDPNQNRSAVHLWANTQSLNYPLPAIIFQWFSCSTEFAGCSSFSLTELHHLILNKCPLCPFSAKGEPLHLHVQYTGFSLELEANRRTHLCFQCWEVFGENSCFSEGVCVVKRGCHSQPLLLWLQLVLGRWLLRPLLLHRSCMTCCLVQHAWRTAVEDLWTIEELTVLKDHTTLVSVGVPLWIYTHLQQERQRMFRGRLKIFVNSLF